jgi:hypothetical protein
MSHRVRITELRRTPIILARTLKIEARMLKWKEAMLSTSLCRRSLNKTDWNKLSDRTQSNRASLLTKMGINQLVMPKLIKMKPNRSLFPSVNNENQLLLIRIPIQANNSIGLPEHWICKRYSQKYSQSKVEMSLLQRLQRGPLHRVPAKVARLK